MILNWHLVVLQDRYQVAALVAVLEAVQVVEDLVGAVVPEAEAVAELARLLGGLLVLAPTQKKYLQHGGLVTRPTLAMLGEAGPEMVTPLGGGGGAMSISPTYNINASISGDMDIRDLATKLNDALVSDYRRLTFR